MRVNIPGTIYVNIKQDSTPDVSMASQVRLIKITLRTSRLSIIDSYTCTYKKQKKTQKYLHMLTPLFRVLHLLS